MVYVLLADGFEEIEALTPADVLRRAGIETALVGVYGKCVTGAHGIKIECDIEIDKADADSVEMIVLPGGLPGADNLRNDKRVMKLVNDADNKKIFIAAICAAPRILGELGILDGKEAVCYPGFEKYLRGAKLSDKRVVRDGSIITAVGMGASAEFALELVSALKSPDESRRIKKGIFA